MELMNQPFTGQLGDRLIQLLNSCEFDVFNVAVAFAKNSGVLRIKKALEEFREKGGKVNVFVGVDLEGTSYEALTNLLLLTDTLNVVHSENYQTFHTKVYHFIGKGGEVLIVGSHNLTGGGLWTNFESSMITELKRKNGSTIPVLSGLDSYIDNFLSLGDAVMGLKVQRDIEMLLENGYVNKEVLEQIRNAKERKRKPKTDRLFGRVSLPKLPKVDVTKQKKVTTNSVPSLTPQPSQNSKTRLRIDANQTLWIESKSMTGGSRNILDLSMKSLIMSGDPSNTPFDLGDDRFMRGAVEYFGVDPSNTNDIQDITLNFDGVDYFDNTILFPVGKKANGTWRLQIKGISRSGKKITDAFRDKGDVDYLVQKIISFTYIDANYYFLSVVAETEIDDFKSSSKILARNGVTNNAKQLGII